MKTRTLIITLLLLAAVAVSAFAQAADAPKERPRPGVAKIVKALDLNKDQAKQIRDIVAKLRQDVEGVAKSGATKEDKASKIKDLRTKAVDAVMALLTPDQQAKAKQIHLEQMIMAPAVAAERMGILFALSKLDLTDQQKASVKAISEESQKAAKAIQDDSSLDKAARRTKLMELRKSTEDKVMAVLTPEQQQKFKDIIAKEKQAVKGRKDSK